MRALLLAAGLGTRLRPLTDHLPKCLVPIHGRPLLDYWLESLLRKGVEEVLINTHYFAPMVVEFLSRSEWAPRVKTVFEEQLLGTGGTILKNREFLGEEPFLVAHADNLTVFDVVDFEMHHRTRPAGTELTMMLFETDDPQSCGIVELDDRGVVRAFHEKVPSPPGNLANAAVYILDPSVVDLAASLGKSTIDLSTEILPRLTGRIFSYRNSSYHRDIGTLESWKAANREFPLKPAAPANAKAWSAIYDTGGGALSQAVAGLMDGAHE